MSTRNEQTQGHGRKGRDPLLLNKIAGGILSAGLVFWVATHISMFFTNHEAPKKPVIAIAGAGAAKTAAGGVPSIDGLIAKADVKKGMSFVQQQCSACHTLTKGGANGVGPNLYGVIGAPMFAKAGYAFSAAAKKKAKGNWTYQKLNEWLVDPQTYVPGTHMSYTGIKNDAVRADAIAYLRTLSPSPVPLPKPGPGGAKPSPAAASGSGAPSIKALYAKAVIAKGQSFFQQQCSACHTVTKGGANGVGPNLYGVASAPMFAKSGFAFSGAVKKIAKGNWTPHALNEWLYAPMKDAPGTHMAYPGIKNDQVRADVIAYLNSQSASPAKLP
ncbi:c-type cytochrome [Acidiphilium iwatense]|uniref:C-type cytochrome n=1 Tax=Acidiphilium iwatense TaxID=768198 RepID=A0ABS9E073_9PROT|nr:c-type cytochrome [Acidiphilium iwatense]MCF3946994.1 c-type cytochrome [Acidiphilium iwatense]